MSIARQTEIMELTHNFNANAQVSLGEYGNEIIKGNVFSCTCLISLASEGVQDYGIVTPTDKDIRLSITDISADINYIKAILYEAPTFTGNAEADIVSYNRQSTTESEVTIYSTFTVAPNITSATVLDTLATLGGATNPNLSIGGSKSHDNYFVLKRDSKYLIRVSNEDTGTANVLIKQSWIETDLTD